MRRRERGGSQASASQVSGGGGKRPCIRFIRCTPSGRRQDCQSWGQRLAIARNERVRVLSEDELLKPVALADATRLISLSRMRS